MKRHAITSRFSKVRDLRVSTGVIREVAAENCSLTPRWNAAELMKEYRKLDDSVTMRMNRSLAQFRDRDRMRADSSSSNPQEESCAYFWKELVGACVHASSPYTIV